MELGNEVFVDEDPIECLGIDSNLDRVGVIR
jgi:hypothetical protein